MYRLSLLVGIAALCVPVTAQTARVGDQVPQFTFPALLNGDGRQSLSDFYGSPVMIDFWGTH